MNSTSLSSLLIFSLKQYLFTWIHGKLHFCPVTYLSWGHLGAPRGQCHWAWPHWSVCFCMECLQVNSHTVLQFMVLFLNNQFLSSVWPGIYNLFLSLGTIKCAFFLASLQMNVLSDSNPSYWNCLTILVSFIILVWKHEISHVFN